MARQFQQEIKALRDSKVLVGEKAEVPGMGSGPSSRMNGRWVGMKPSSPRTRGG